MCFLSTTATTKAREQVQLQSGGGEVGAPWDQLGSEVREKGLFRKVYTLASTGHIRITLLFSLFILWDHVEWIQPSFGCIDIYPCHTSASRPAAASTTVTAPVPLTRQKKIALWLNPKLTSMNCMNYDANLNNLPNVEKKIALCFKLKEMIHYQIYLRHFILHMIHDLFYCFCMYIYIAH